MRSDSGAIHVAHVLTSLDIGGAEMVVVRLIGATDPRRVASRVICLRRTGPLADALRDHGVGVESLDVPPAGGALALARALRRELRRDPPDVVHTHNVSPFIAAGIALIGQPRIRLVHTKHGRSTAAGWAGRLALRHAARRASTIAAVSADAARQAIEEEGFPAARVRTLHNGVELGNPPVTRPGAFRAVTVARLEAVKDQATMLHAVRLVVEREPRFHLDIVGDGNERPRLEALAGTLGIAAHVTFHGFRTDVRPMLDAADVFLLSSLSEGISLTLLEAMAAGLPIVATRVGGNPEVVSDGDTGLLVGPADPRAIADATLAIMEDPAAAERMGRAGRARVEAQFSMQAMLDGYLAAYAVEAP